MTSGLPFASDRRSIAACRERAEILTFADDARLHGLFDSRVMYHSSLAKIPMVFTRLTAELSAKSSARVESVSRDERDFLARLCLCARRVLRNMFFREPAAATPGRAAPMGSVEAPMVSALVAEPPAVREAVDSIGGEPLTRRGRARP